jgi:hypothetical protein
MDVSDKEILKQAKLINIEDGLAEFVLIDKQKIQESNEEEENIFFWPQKHLPKGIEIGEEIIIAMDFKNKKERALRLQKKLEQEKKQAEMRKLLEELVN